MFIVMILPSILLNSPFILFGLFFVLIVGLVYLKGISQIRYILIMFLFFFLVSLTVNFIFTNAGTSVIFQISELPIIGGHKRLSLELILFTLTATCRLIYIIMMFNLISILTNEDRTMAFFSRYLRNFPLLLSFSIRLIPKLKEDYKRLEHIFKLRGFSVINKKENSSSKKRSGGIFGIKKIINPKLMGALLRTLLMNSLEDSLQFAESMQARGFGDFKKRSVYSKERLSIIDILILFFSVIYFVFSILMFKFSIGVKNIYPKFKLYKYINNSELIALFTFIVINLILFIICAKFIQGKKK